MESDIDVSKKGELNERRKLVYAVSSFFRNHVYLYPWILTRPWLKYHTFA